MVVDCEQRNHGIPVRAEGGLHPAVMPVHDALGHEGSVEMFVDVQSAGS